MKSTVLNKSFWCTLLLLLVVAVSMTATGCAKKVKIDTTNLDYSFQTAEQPLQATVTEAIEAIDKGDVAGGLEKLKKVSADPKLSAEQKTAVSGVVAQLEKH